MSHQIILPDLWSLCHRSCGTDIMLAIVQSFSSLIRQLPCINFKKHRTAVQFVVFILQQQRMKQAILASHPINKRRKMLFLASHSLLFQSFFYHFSFLSFTSTSKAMMAKIQRLRFVTEVAPPRLISVIRRPMEKLLATIHEEESEIIGRSLSVPLARTSTGQEKNL